ncbi:phage antirepressor [Nosocomiicoccus sp. HMSC059G07]|uniref:phage antirepressor n=1 Tax=Nosocomiicoccus sp. HMSC059G07 TaxID=1739531 RepID=UPI0008A2B2C2|nr:phage antirepressor [Nosocomiicoccus sp. HMSC059G07]OFO55633.1 phage antirepressor [Nosocomiicoccus sp. HMSC059G07]
MQELQIFNFEELPVRTLMIEDEPYFVGKDVAGILGYSNSRDALNRHVDKEDKDVVKLDTLGGRQSQSVINESGLYSLIFSSKLDSAKRFKRWVTSEVLPQIRKHGVYATESKIDDILNDPDSFIELLENFKEERKHRLMAEQQVLEMKPKADYYDQILKSKKLIAISQIAKDYGMSAQAMNKLLHELKVQYKQGGQWLLYQNHATKGYTSSETHQYKKKDGTEDFQLLTKWTQKGRIFLYELLKHEDILPLIERE